jgi:phosphonate transport system substrate-binding protein
MFQTQIIKTAVVMTALALLTACSNPPMAKSAKLVMGVQATRPDETRAAWLPLVQDIGRKHGMVTELVTASQVDTVNALRDGRVDVVWLSSNVAIDAVVDAGAEAFALYYNVNGTKGYSAVLLTRADSGITKLDQALTPGRYSYASGAKTSTSGYVLPQHFLFNKQGTAPEKLFKSVVYGGHFPNLDALWVKKVDMAINNTTDMAVFQARTPGAKEGLRVLWTSPEVPNDVLMVRKNAPDAVKQTLKDIFLNYGKNSLAERELLKRASGISHFISTNNSVLEPVSEFKFTTERLAVQNNTALSTADRTAQLVDLDRRVASFKAALGDAK